MFKTTTRLLAAAGLAAAVGLGGAAQAETVLRASHQWPGARAICATRWCRSSPVR